MKRTISLIIVLALFAAMLPVYAGNGVTQIPSFDAETLIEAESGYAEKDDMDIRDSLTASGAKGVLMSYRSKLENPSPDHKPDMSYKITIPSDGKYYVYMRYNASDTGKDSLHIRWDGGEYVNVGLKVVDQNAWGWQALAGTNLTAGEHELSFLHREPNCVIDAFVVTSDYKAFDTAAVEESIKDNVLIASEFANNSTANTFTPVDGYVSFEAEDATIDEYNKTTNPTGTFSILTDENASGGVYVMPLTRYDSSIGGYPPRPSGDVKGGMEFNIISESATTYYVWIRVLIPSGGNDSSWVSFDGADYKEAPNFTPTNSSGTAVYEWRKMGAFSTMSANEKHNFRMYPREGGSRIDRVVITDIGRRVPSGLTGELVGMMLPEGVYPVPTILPPENQHPRLYFTSADIPQIKANMQKQQNLAAVEEFEKILAMETNGSLTSSVIANYTNYNSNVMKIIEAYAFKYALDKDTAEGLEYGIKAKNAVLNFVSDATFDINGQDITRQMGHTIFLASQVYDWCYDLFSDHEKELVISRCEEIASLMEVGYPPKGQGAVCGHAGEAQILRDLLGFAIATYDERPDIYNYVGGRFFSQFIQPRNFWYESATHHQGDAYGSYRYYWEVMAQQIIYRMTGGDTNGGIKPFNDTQGDVPYFWIYTRRPDGQVFRTGDCYLEKYSTSSGYWNSYVNPMFMASNFYGDPIIKGEYEIENPMGAFAYGTDTRTPVVYLLFNDPDLEANTDKSSLPLTRYFGSPNGMMIARTGWDVNDSVPSQSGDVVAMMKIGERWGANHHHLDAGNFQLYYKGILASESGYYETYGSLHDANYNKRSIAHNILTIYDPNEKFRAFNGYDRYENAVSFPDGVNDGGQRSPGGEPATWEIWNGEKGLNYDTGIVLDHEFGPDKNTPEYTYIKGDITQAYSDKVSSVIRSMAFMPLDDENYPAIMVIMDKVTSTNPTFKKKWLLHMQQEPEIDTSTNTSVIKNTKEGYNGKMTVQTLLPKNASITKVGGDGKRYWIGNQAGDFENDGYNFDTLSDIPQTAEVEAGWGRIEVSPAESNLTDKFLNVLAVSDADNTAVPLDSQLIEGVGLVGVKTADKVLMFADTDTPSTEKNRVLDSASFTVPAAEGKLDIMIAGVKAGMWIVSNGVFTARCTAGEDGGVLYFEGGSGEYTLTYIGADAYDAEIKSIEALKNTTESGITVELNGAYEGATLIAAVFDEYDALKYVTSKPCAAESLYTFNFTESDVGDVSGLSDIKVYLWDSISGMKALARSGKISAGAVFGIE